MRPNPGDVIGGKFRIIRMIGDGGMGAVYEARHEVLGTSVALKFLHTELARRQGLATRFLQEARVSASIQSPHVTKVTDVEQTADGTPYLVMELLSGESLQQLLDRQRKLPKDQAIDFALQILSGLEAAHALGVVHRDLKPDNVFITPSTGGPVCKLLDFGIAKLRQTNDYNKGLTRPGALMGTPEYMSPEQLYSADRVDHRADLYSIGVLLFEMLAGERPAIGEDAAAIVGNVMAGKVKRLDELDKSLPAELVQAVHRGIDPDKGRRFQSAVDMRSALAAFAGQLSHAGKLAATPVPAGVSGLPPPPDADTSKVAEPAKPPITADEPAPEPAKPGVAPTLPPDDEPAAGGSPPTVGDMPAQNMPPHGSTQEASKDLIANIAAQNAAAQAVTAQPNPAPYGRAAPQPGPYPPQHFPPPVARKSSGGGSGVILALLGGLLVIGAIVGGIIWVRQNKDDSPKDQPLGFGTQAPPTTVTGQGTFNDKPPDVPQNPPPVDPGPGPKPTATGGPVKPKPKDAGADAAGGQDAGGQMPWPFPVPSNMPPLPPFPTIPIPVWPPPASSQ
ncbi:MAG: protein kinase [Myxococcales bacterium]|nr:protein kinase [Myxococcales bacterium]